MTKAGSKSKEMRIHVSTEDGKVIKVVNENGKEATPVTLKELEQTFQSKVGVKHVALILHTHASPGCVLIIIGGRAYMVCF